MIARVENKALPAGTQVGFLHVAAALMILMPLVVTPVIPAIDLYNHIARFYILSHPSIPEFAGNYMHDWRLLPNLGVDLIAVPLMHVLPALVVAKLIVAFIILLLFSGTLYFAAALHGRANLVAIPFVMILAYSYILNWGFINFLLGLGVMFWTMGAGLRLRERPVQALLICSIGAVATFLCHGFAFMLYGIVAGMIEFGFWLAAPGRNIGRLLRSWAMLAGQAVLPVIVFLQAPTANAEGTSTFGNLQRYSQNGLLSERLQREFEYRLKTIYRVAESPYLTFDIATFLLIVVAALISLKRGWWHFDRRLLPAVIVLAVICVVIPTNFFSASYLSDRIPLVTALICVAGVSISADLCAKGRMVAMFMGGIALLRLAVTAWGWSEYRTTFSEYERLMQRIPSGALVYEVIVKEKDRRDGPQPRCQMYRPLLVPLRHAVTPLFAIPGQQPLVTGGDLLATEAALGLRTAPPLEGVAKYDRIVKRLERSQFDYVLICGQDRLSSPLPVNFVPEGQAGNLTLFRIIHVQR